MAPISSSRPAHRCNRSAVQEHAVLNSERFRPSDVWELDFRSRPLLDERGKKVLGITN